MNKVYELWIDFTNEKMFSQCDCGNEFNRKYWNWEKVNLTSYIPINYRLVKTLPNNSKRISINYDMDISLDNGLIILNDKTKLIFENLNIINIYGKLLDINTESQTNKYYGFYPNNKVYNKDIVNESLSSLISEDEVISKSRLCAEVVLNNSYPKDIYLFVISDIPCKIFVTDKFKQLVENSKLKGLNFKEVQVID